jgi:hypothetical protein
LLYLFFSLSACTGEHQLTLDGQKSFTLIVRDQDANKRKECLIQPESNEYKALANWLKSNQDGWEKGPFKWLSPFELYSENYRLQFSDKSALIKVKKNDKYHMWRRKVDSSLVDIFEQYKTYNKSLDESRKARSAETRSRDSRAPLAERSECEGAWRRRVIVEVVMHRGIL